VPFNILAQRDDLVHMNTFDLCLAESRVSFIKAMASEMYVNEQVIKKELGKLLLELERRGTDKMQERKSTVRNRFGFGS
jgi:hypothetical protein